MAKHSNTEATHSATVTREIDDREVTLDVPFAAEQLLTAVTAAHLNRMIVNGFVAIVNKDAKDRGKHYSDADLLARWSQYAADWLERAPGTSRDGQTTRELAAERFVREHLASIGSAWPVMPKITAKMAADKREAAGLAQRRVAATREAYIAKALASMEPSTVARIAELVADIQAERKREKPTGEAPPPVESVSF